MASIIPLDHVAPELVEQLLDRAFDPGRRTRTAYKVREGMAWLPALSFAAIGADELLAGTIHCWPVGLTDPDGRAHPMIMVGPVAVLPEEQGFGFGRALVTASLAALNPACPLPQVMIGDPEYYGRFWGFTSVPTRGWTLPGPSLPERLLVRFDTPAMLPPAGTLGPWRG